MFTAASRNAIRSVYPYYYRCCQYRCQYVPSRSLHPEKRLKLARERALAKLRIEQPEAFPWESPPKDQSHSMNQTVSLSTKIEDSTRYVPSRSLHPEKRLKLARERALAKLRTEQPEAFPWESPSKDQSQSTPTTKIDTNIHQKENHTMSFNASVAKSHLTHLLDESEGFGIPPPRRNDGTSSGATSNHRLRKARKEALQRLLDDLEANK